MTPEDLEFQTLRITPASMTKRKRFARRRSEELSAIQSDGWEIIDIEPERIFRRGDKVTVRRPAEPSGPKPRVEQSPPLGGKWIAAIAGVIAVLLLLVVLDAVL